MNITVIYTLSNIVIMLGLIGLLYFFHKKHISFTKRIFIALGLGFIFGMSMQYFCMSQSP